MDELPSDVAFTLYLAAIDVARFSDWEWRVYKYHRLMVGSTESRN